MVRGRGALSVCVDVSVDVETGLCIVLVYVDASTKVDMGWAMSYVYVAVSTGHDIGGSGVGEWGLLLGGRRPKGWRS